MKAGRPWVWITAVALGLAHSLSAHAQEVYRWKDDEGKVHYTTTLPPEAANRPYDVLSSDGIVIKRVTDPLKEQLEPEKETKELVPIYSEAEKRSMSDRLLMLKYRSEDDIQEAMRFELDQIAYDKKILASSQSNATQSLSQQIRSAADRQRAGLDVEEQQLGKIRQLRQQLAEAGKARENLAEREQAIRDRYGADLKRFRELIAATSGSG